MRRTAFAGGIAALAAVWALMFMRGTAPAPAADLFGETKKVPRTINTAGNATVRVKPDAARVFFGVQTTAPTIQAARVDNNTRVRKIMAALTALKIADLKTKTSDIHVEILYGRHDGNQLPPITGYRVSTTFTVLVQDEDSVKLGGQASRVLDAALENGANQVQQIVFLKKEGMAQARRKALTMAVEDALANAQALAAGAKKDHLETVSIQGQPTYGERPYYQNSMQAQVANVAIPEGGEGNAMLIAGDLEVSCQVSISCTF